MDLTFSKMRQIGLAIGLLTIPTLAAAGVVTFSVDSHTSSSTSGTLASGYVQCSAGHQVLIFGSVTEIVIGQLASTIFSTFVNCNGIVQQWTATAYNTSGVALQPGRAAVNAFIYDYSEYTLGPPVNEMIIVSPAVQ